MIEFYNGSIGFKLLESLDFCFNLRGIFILDGDALIGNESVGDGWGTNCNCFEGVENAFLYSLARVVPAKNVNECMRTAMLCAD